VEEKTSMFAALAYHGDRQGDYDTRLKRQVANLAAAHRSILTYTRQTETKRGEVIYSTTLHIVLLMSILCRDVGNAASRRGDRSGQNDMNINLILIHYTWDP